MQDKVTRRWLLLGCGAVGAAAVLGAAPAAAAAAADWEDQKAAFWQRMRELGRETTLHLPAPPWLGRLRQHYLTGLVVSDPVDEAAPGRSYVGKAVDITDEVDHSGSVVGWLIGPHDTIVAPLPATYTHASFRCLGASVRRELMQRMAAYYDFAIRRYVWWQRIDGSAGGQVVGADDVFARRLLERAPRFGVLGTRHSDAFGCDLISVGVHFPERCDWEPVLP